MTKPKKHHLEMMRIPDEIGAHELNEGDQFEYRGELHTFKARSEGRLGWWIKTEEKSFPTFVGRQARLRRA